MVAAFVLASGIVDKGFISNLFTITRRRSSFCLVLYRPFPDLFFSVCTTIIRWFVAGSIGFMLTSALTLANSYDSHELLGQDDSTLTLRDYRATWWLMTISGAFLIFGELSSPLGISVGIVS
jgi:hypothetical protein